MDTAPMFEKGTYIVYVNGDRYEIGRVVSTHPDGAFVCYHEGETAAKTPYECMHRLENQYVMTSLGGDRFADVSIDDMEDLVNKKVNEIVDKMVEPKTGKWIPISEKLPETGDSILVTYSDGEVGIVWSARPKVWGKYEKANNLIFPVAWMPLPEPYREDGEA